MEINQQLKKDLIQIYEKYLMNPNDKKLKEKAKKLYTKFLNAGPLLDKNVSHALNLLVDVGYDLPNPPKPSKETIENLLKKLKK